MKKINFYILSLLGLCLFVELSCTKTTKKSDKPMNVLFITIDDLRPTLGCYDAPLIKSPNIDAIASEGIIFERAYCQAAICAPSRPSFLSGLRPDSTGVYGFIKTFREKAPNVVTLPELFKNNGYLSTYYGKVFHSDKPDPQSWSREGHITEPKAWRGYVLKESKMLDSIAIATPGPPQYGPAFEMADFPDEAYPDSWIADSAINVLEEVAITGQPFFLAVGFIKPHLPFVSPKKYWDMYNPEDIQLPDYRTEPVGSPLYSIDIPGGITTRYSGFEDPKKVNDEMMLKLNHGFLASISFVDAQLGRVIDKLKELGLYDNTLIVVLGDHGQKVGEYGAFMKGSNFEIDTRAPLILNCPGRRDKGIRTNALVELVDIYPSVCELAGIEKPAHLQGTSLNALWETPNMKWEDYAFSQRKEDKYLGNAMRTDKYRLVVWSLFEDRDSIVAIELYDHETDPLETLNIAQSHENKELVDKLVAEYYPAWEKSLQTGK
jgi:arylsulfatase A-like enzyme